MSFLTRIFARDRQRAALEPLYRAVVAAGREPFWYRDAGVPDTMDGRFDMIAAVLALVLLRMEREGEAARADSVLLTEAFVEDMDATLRQIGIGEVVGKHVGRMMGALGGRLGAFRLAEGDERAFAAAVRRNLFHEAPASDEALERATARLAGFRDGLAAADYREIRTGRLPPA